MDATTMTDEQRKTIALEYLRRLDRGAPFFDLFDDHAEVFFPKWGIATGRAACEQLFADPGSIVSKFKHDLAYLNVIQQGNTVVVEGTSYGTSKGGVARGRDPRRTLVRCVRDSGLQDPALLHIPRPRLRGRRYEALSLAFPVTARAVHVEGASLDQVSGTCVFSQWQKKEKTISSEGRSMLTEANC